MTGTCEACRSETERIHLQRADRLEDEEDAMRTAAGVSGQPGVECHLHMTDRTRHLAAQLAATMDALSVRTTGADVLLFLELLARLESLEAPDLSEAQAARLEHAADLARIAGDAIGLERLLHTGRHLEPDDRDGWIRDVLTVATVAPWLEPARRAEVAHAVEVAAAMVEAAAEDFLDASVLTWDRHHHEAPARLGVEAQLFLRTLADLPIVVAWDRSTAAGR